MIDTEIPGRPRTVENAAGWLRHSLLPAVDSGVGALAEGRKLAESDWRSPAGDAFGGQVSQGLQRTAELSVDIATVAQGFDQYAADLRGARKAMGAIRQAARAAGLTVHGFVIEDPGAGPRRPADPLPGMTPRQADQHSAAVTAYALHQQLIAAYDTAAADAEAVVADYVAACEKVRILRQTLVVLKPAEIIGVKAVKRFTGAVESALAGEAKHTSDSASAWEQELDRRRYGYYPGGHDGFYRDHDSQHGEDDRARAAQERHDRNKPLRGLGRSMEVFDRFTGPVGLGLDIHTDIKQGESKTQAVTSNVGGAGMGAVAGAGAGALTVGILSAAGVGAAAGSAVPVLGTVVGAAVGLGVGIVASGAIDSVFEKGPDVGKALANGVDDLKDTAEAAKDLGGSVIKGVGGVAKSIGGLFD